MATVKRGRNDVLVAVLGSGIGARAKKRRRTMIVDDQDHELTYWSEKLGIPRDELGASVVREGTMRRAVEKCASANFRHRGLRTTTPWTTPGGEATSVTRLADRRGHKRTSR